MAKELPGGQENDPASFRAGFAPGPFPDEHS